MISYEQFKEIYDLVPGEPEYYLTFENNDKEYMIIKYKDGPSFQRCGNDDGSDEYYYESLEQLYYSDLIDGINLSKDWAKITDLLPNGYGSVEELCHVFGIDCTANDKIS